MINKNNNNYKELKEMQLQLYVIKYLTQLDTYSILNLAHKINSKLVYRTKDKNDKEYVKNYKYLKVFFNKTQEKLEMENFDFSFFKITSDNQTFINDYIKKYKEVEERANKLACTNFKGDESSTISNIHARNQFIGLINRKKEIGEIFNYSFYDKYVNSNEIKYKLKSNYNGIMDIAESIYKKELDKCLEYIKVNQLIAEEMNNIQINKKVKSKKI